MLMACECWKSRTRELGLIDATNRFRWASLQLQSLCNLYTDEAIQERLGRLPPKLEELYLELYQKLKSTTANADREIATGTLTWLLCAQRKLSSEEFLAALSYTARGQFDKLTIEQVLHLCSNLVIYDPTLDTFRFAHLSVREFLENQPECSPGVANALAAETCLLHVLSFADNPATQRFISRYRHGLLKSPPSDKLSTYSTIYWAPHYQLASTERTAGVLKDLLFHFLSNESDPRSPVVAWAVRVEKALHNYSIAWDLRERLEDTKANRDRALFIASCFNLQEAASIPTHAGGYIQNSRSRGLLEVAATHGSCDVISELIKYKHTKIRKEVVKAAAGNEGNGKEVMTLLLEQRGADVVITEEIMKAAARNGRSGKEIMMLLLEQRGADVVITEEVVKAAAGNGGNGKEVMMLLLKQRGADVVITEEIMKAAARNGRSGKEIMMLLLEQRGADVVITEEVVKAASTSGQRSVLNVIQENLGIFISEDQWLTAQFYNAAKYGYLDIIQQLLAKRVEPDLKDTIGRSPLWMAAASGHSEVVQVLLSTNSVDINSKSLSARSPIFWAAACGYKTVVKLLLEAGADPKDVDEDGNTPLSIAKENGFHDMEGMIARYSSL